MISVYTIIIVLIMPTLMQINHVHPILMEAHVNRLQPTGSELDSLQR